MALPVGAYSGDGKTALRVINGFHAHRADVTVDATDVLVVEPIHRDKKRVRKGLSIAIDPQLAAVLGTRLQEDRVTLTTSGVFVLQGDTGGENGRKNTLASALLDGVLARLSPADRAIMAGLRERCCGTSDPKCIGPAYRFVLEHRTADKGDYTRGNVFVAVVQFVNSKFQETDEGSSAFAGVGHRPDRKLRPFKVQITLEPGAKGWFGGCYADESEAGRVVLDAFDEKLEPAKFDLLRTVVHIYDADGTLHPRLETLATFTEVARTLRPTIYTDDWLAKKKKGTVAAYFHPAPKRRKKTATTTTTTTAVADNCK